MTDERDKRVAEPETGDTCPFELLDPRSDIEPTDPCPVCGMLGTLNAEDKCVGWHRRL